MAGLASPGQSESGDQHVALFFPGGVLVAVVDGLGHGDEAALAAKTAVEALEHHAGESLFSLVQHCHEALRETRGVVMSLAEFRASDNAMTWLGVGNVAGVLLHSDVHPDFAQETLSSRGGIVGHQLPRLYGSVIRLVQGDTLIFATDGIRSGFELGMPLGGSPQEIADHILASCGRGTDDALVLVVRYLDHEYAEGQ